MKFRRLRPLVVFLLLIVPTVLASGRDEEDPYEEMVKEANRNPREGNTPEISVHSTTDQLIDNLNDYFYPEEIVEPSDSLDEARRRLNQQALATVALDTADQQMRRAAVNALTDETLLTEVARMASDPVVRLSATRKLTDLIVLDEIAVNDKDPNVRHVAATRLEELRDPEAFAYGQVTIKVYHAPPIPVPSGATPPGSKPQPATEEEFATQTEILSSPAFSKAVAARLSNDERERFLAPYTFESNTGTTVPDIAEILTLNKTITLAPETGTIVIRYYHPDPEAAALVANYFADELITENVRLQVENAMVAVEDLRNRADGLHTEIKSLQEQLNPLQKKADAGPLTPDEDKQLQSLKQEIEAETIVLANVIQRLEEEKNSITLDQGGLTPRIVERAKPPASPDNRPASQADPTSTSKD